MDRRARRPLDPEATKRANDDLYRKYEHDPRPNSLFDAEGRRKPLDPRDADHEKLRNEWMANYAAHGGAVDEKPAAVGKPVSSAVQPCSQCWIVFIVIDDKTNEPIPNVELEVTAPSQTVTRYITDRDGKVEIRPAECGPHDLSSRLDRVTLDTILEPGKTTSQPRKPAAVDTKKTSPPASPSNANDDNEDDEPLAIYRLTNYIGHVKEHKVRTGETLDSIAKSYDLTWKQLAQFNWGTNDPKRLNQHFRDDLGCRKKSNNGYNFLFTDDDEPGILYAPKKWRKTDLAHNTVHIVRVVSTPYFLIILENEKGLRIPEAEYKATLADGSERKDRLGRNGMARIVDPPPGKVEVIYTNLDVVEVKSLAACARQAFDDRDFDEIIRVLHHSPEMLRDVVAAYSTYYNDYTGQGFINDVYHEASDPHALNVVEGLLAQAELPTRNPVHFVEWESDTELDNELDDPDAPDARSGVM